MTEGTYLIGYKNYFERILFKDLTETSDPFFAFEILEMLIILLFQSETPWAV